MIETTPAPPRVEDIQTEILRRICFVEYQAGDQLKEAQLASEFGVSRTPVRDAISRISHLGLVETRNGVGTVVRQLSKAEILHVYEVRLELATMIGTLSPRTISQDDIATCEALVADVCELSERFDAKHYVHINHKLHEFIASLIGNDVLRSFWWQTYYQAASTWYQLGDVLGSRAANALVKETTEIKAALENGDMRAVGYVQRIHIGYGFEHIKKHLLADIDR